MLPAKSISRSTIRSLALSTGVVGATPAQRSVRDYNNYARTRPPRSNHYHLRMLFYILHKTPSYRWRHLRSADFMNNGTNALSSTFSVIDLPSFTETDILHTKFYIFDQICRTKTVYLVYELLTFLRNIHSPKSTYLPTTEKDL